MNLFMPYPSVIKSVGALDDRRLIKQILECKVILDIALGKKSGYAKHPVCVHYKDYVKFVAYYANQACCEYTLRFRKDHSYEKDFIHMYVHAATPTKPLEILYAAGSKGSKDCIRATGKKVHDMFKQKLIEKWNNDKVPPKWTNWEIPEFYKENRNVEQTK